MGRREEILVLAEELLVARAMVEPEEDASSEITKAI